MLSKWLMFDFIAFADVQLYRTVQVTKNGITVEAERERERGREKKETFLMKMFRDAVWTGAI